MDAWDIWEAISIHSPHARGDADARGRPREHPQISIHSPHARGDAASVLACSAGAVFQSTPLMRGETRFVNVADMNRSISIHSPHARGDILQLYTNFCVQISIHSPHARGDHARTPGGGTLRISIHSPHARGDTQHFTQAPPRYNFNPLPSCEGRQHKPPKIRLDSRQFIQQKHHSSFF